MTITTEGACIIFTYYRHYITPLLSLCLRDCRLGDCDNGPFPPICGTKLPTFFACDAFEFCRMHGVPLVVAARAFILPVHVFSAGDGFTERDDGQGVTHLFS